MSERLMTEREFVEELRREYQAGGFTELDPKRIAESLGGAYEPDFAFKLGDLVEVIELKSKQRPQTAMQIRKLRKIVEAHPNWRFRFLVVPKRPAPPTMINAEDSVPRRLGAARRPGTLRPRAGNHSALAGHRDLPPAASRSPGRASPIRRLGHADGAGTTQPRRAHRRGPAVLERGFRAQNLAVHGFRLARDQMPPAGLFDFAQELCARAGIEVAGPKRVAQGRL